MDAEYWLALSHLPGVGRATFLKLIAAYKSPKLAWQHNDSDWRETGIFRRPVQTESSRSDALVWAKIQVDQLAKSPWSLIVFGDSRYPESLTRLRYAPPYFFLLGAVPDAPAVAVVGARQATEYGVRATRMIVGQLAAAGITIVSGFARGIDTVAHTAALEANGSTIAIWGAGPDTVYPPENKKLVEPVIQRGAVLTEFPFGTPPDAHNFPIRNRLIAGLSQGVLIVQAGRRSGALLTAQHALDQGKEVYAIPSEIGQEQFGGTLELLKQGARLVTSADDILSGFRIMRSETSAAPLPRPLPPLTEIERQVYDGLGGSACHIDRLAVSLRLSVGECARVLTLLELKGLVKKSAGNLVSRQS
ncbi:MAG: DNA-processing protein DprA [Candidatus Zixiibacteriota bacterium]